MVDDPKYYSHFSLTRINPDGSTSLLEYPEEGCTWSNTFKNGVELDEGDYALVTGTRLANGGVLSEMQLFHVKQAETNVVKMFYVLLIPRLRLRETLIRSLNSSWIVRKSVF